MVNNGTVDRDFTVIHNVFIPTTNEKTANVETFERRLNEKIDREMGYIVDTVEVNIKNAILIAIDNIMTQRIEFAVKSINASSGRDAASVTANLEREKRMGSTLSSENVSERNNTFHELNAIDETRGNIPDEVGELSVSETHFHRQLHTHHTNQLLDKLKKQHQPGTINE